MISQHEYMIHRKGELKRYITQDGSQEQMLLETVL